MNKHKSLLNLSKKRRSTFTCAKSLLGSRQASACVCALLQPIGGVRTIWDVPTLTGFLLAPTADDGHAALHILRVQSVRIANVLNLGAPICRPLAF